MTVVIEKLAFYPYNLPLCHSLPTALEIVSHRQGIAIRCVARDGTTGWGESAPLTGFGMETLTQTQQALRHMENLLLGTEIDSVGDINELAIAYSHVPAAKHGMELALLDLLARSQNKPLAWLLNPHSRSEVPVNALIGAVSPEIAAIETQKLCEQGYSCIKVKVGIDRDRDWQRLVAVRTTAGDRVQIRIDANQAWSVGEAILRLNSFESLGIEYAEQPVAASNLEGMATVRSAIGIKVAADESVTNMYQLHQVISQQAADIIVLKPMALGGILAARRAAETAIAAGLDVVFTTTLDGAIARTGALHLAASMPQVMRACGLATGDLLDRDLCATFPIPERGIMHVPSLPGLGIEKT